MNWTEVALIRHSVQNFVPAGFFNDLSSCGQFVAYVYRLPPLGGVRIYNSLTIREHVFRRADQQDIGSHASKSTQFLGLMPTA
jgi:hypothetical protein